MYQKLIVFGAKYLIVVICLVFVWVFLKHDKNKRREVMVFGVLVLPLTYLLAKIMSSFYYDPRPFVQSNIAPLIVHAADNGFPSDHTLFGSALAAVIFFFNKKTGILLLFLTIIMGISRVLAGVHHLIDIIGAIFIAFITGWIVKKFVFPYIISKF